jgi:hypothetical protein
MTYLDDSRLERLQEMLDGREGSRFCNNMVLVSEMRSMVAELIKYRDGPLHCPGCDGDHL